MTAQELAKRNEKAQQLRVIRVTDDDFYVESEEGKICYKTMVSGSESWCACGDYARNVKTDSLFKCKHILAVINCLPTGDLENAQYLEKVRPKLDKSFIITVDGTDFVKYAGLLDLAHQKKLTKLDVEILQYPTQENEKTAICKAIAVTMTGESYADVGDANPSNCNARVAKHIIRMASTRAKARALRDLTDVGFTALEELGDLDEIIGREEKGTAQKMKPIPKKIVKSEAKTSQPDNGNGHPIDIRLAPPEENAGNGNGKGSGVKEVKETPKEVKEIQKETKPVKESGKSQAKSVEKSGGNGQDKAKTESPPPSMSEAQKRAIYNLSRRRGISVEDLEKMSQEAYRVPLEKLSPSDASAFIRNLQHSA
jgi:hypothetical protein